MQLATPGPAAQATNPPAATATRVRAAAPAPTATRDPNIVVITEQDVLKMMNAGVTEQEGATMEGGGVDFNDGKMILTADRMTYGFVSIDDLRMVARLVARDGKLKMETESITPRGVVTALIPTLADQALAKYTSKWYVEDVQTYDDRMELRIRP